MFQIWKIYLIHSAKQLILSWNHTCILLRVTSEKRRTMMVRYSVLDIFYLTQLHWNRRKLDSFWRFSLILSPGFFFFFFFFFFSQIPSTIFFNPFVLLFSRPIFTAMCRTADFTLHSETNDLLCFRHLSESRFLLNALHRRSKFSNFCHDLMENHVS